MMKGIKFMMHYFFVSRQVRIRVWLGIVFMTAIFGNGCSHSVSPQEELVPLASGNAGAMSYTLYRVISHSGALSSDCDLIMIVRGNGGAKFIHMPHLTAENFSIQDSQT